jgi:hypothetical protein
LEDSIPTFYVKSTEMGIWKEKYVIQLKNFGINENIQVLKRNRIRLSGSYPTYYKNCELFLRELLSIDKLYEIFYEDDEGIDFVKLNNTYRKPQLLRYL